MQFYNLQIGPNLIEITVSKKNKLYKIMIISPSNHFFGLLQNNSTMDFLIKCFPYGFFPLPVSAQLPENFCKLESHYIILTVVINTLHGD